MEKVLDYEKDMEELADMLDFLPEEMRKPFITQLISFLMSN